MRTRRGLGWLAAVSLLGAACSGGGDDDAGGSEGGGGGDLPECPLDALDDATAPVEITFWHTMTRANEEALVSLTDAFNASQDDVVVTLVNNVASNDQHEKFLANLSSNPDELPDLIQSQESYLQQMHDCIGNTVCVSTICCR